MSSCYQPPLLMVGKASADSVLLFALFASFLFIAACGCKCQSWRLLPLRVQLLSTSCAAANMHNVPGNKQTTRAVL
jgi:hypothetical protein